MHYWTDLKHQVVLEQMGNSAYELIKSLYPLCRSITGKGTQETLNIINKNISLDITALPTGTQVFDWQIPKEWNISGAYVIDPTGKKILDFKELNLHVSGYSIPINKCMSKQALLPHLHSLPNYPDWVPYTYFYHKETWGFSISHNQLLTLPDGDYHVVIDSTLEDGHLHYGEHLISGKSDEEFLIYTHICHPSLCNDNLSGIAVAVEIAKHLQKQNSLNYSYRFVFAPTTIGSISWLSQNQDQLQKIKAGLVIAVAGDKGPLTYKLSKDNESNINKLALQALKRKEFNTLEFEPFGYDERQFSSPGINLPIGRLTRTPNGCYPEYHTSADNLEIVKPEFLSDTIESCFDIIELFENNIKFRNTRPYGEPHLGRHGLYEKAGAYNIKMNTLALLWVLNLSDGEHSVVDIIERSKLPYSEILNACKALQEVELITPIN